MMSNNNNKTIAFTLNNTLLSKQQRICRASRSLLISCHVIGMTVYIASNFVQERTYDAMDKLGILTCISGYITYNDFKTAELDYIVDTSLDFINESKHGEIIYNKKRKTWRIYTSPEYSLPFEVRA